MSVLDLKDVKPMDCTIELFGQQFTLRKFNMLDQVWITESFTEDERKTLFTEKMLDTNLARVAFHQLTFEDQQKIGTHVQKFLHEDTGETVEHEFKGWRALLGKIGGLPEKFELFRGIMTAIGMSQPVLEKMFTPEEMASLQVKVTEKKKTLNRAKRRTGRK